MNRNEKLKIAKIAFPLITEAISNFQQGLNHDIKGDDKPEIIIGPPSYLIVDGEGFDLDILTIDELYNL